jgi:hypothetical protein
MQQVMYANGKVWGALDLTPGIATGDRRLIARTRQGHNHRSAESFLT